MSDVTRILSQLDQGDPAATEKLLPLVYDELRRLAAARLSQEKPGQTMQATGLVHEAYVRLAAGSLQQRWNGRGHFFAAAAEAMRRILIEQARRKSSCKGGGGFQRVEMPDSQLEVREAAGCDLLALNDALEKLASVDRRKAKLVELRFFAGLTLSEAAAVLGVSDSTADADWAYAKAFLRVELGDW